MISENVYSVTEVARELGLSTGRVRQICLEIESEGGEIGQKVGNTRVLNGADVEIIRHRPDRRKTAESA